MPDQFPTQVAPPDGRPQSNCFRFPNFVVAFREDGFGRLFRASGMGEPPYSAGIRRGET